MYVHIYARLLTRPCRVALFAWNYNRSPPYSSNAIADRGAINPELDLALGLMKV